jgi:post-segregation antitoxin (ccd killing protein)
MRLNVTVPDGLIARVREEHPDLNVSGVLQQALRRS